MKTWTTCGVLMELRELDRGQNASRLSGQQEARAD